MTVFHSTLQWRCFYLDAFAEPFRVVFLPPVDYELAKMVTAVTDCPVEMQGGVTVCFT